MNQVIPRHARTAKKHDVIRPPILPNLCSPRSASLRVPRGEMRNHPCIVNGDDIPIRQNPVRNNSRESELVAKCEIPVPAAFHQSAILPACGELCPCPLLELRKSPGMIEMCVAAHQVLHIFRFESELANVVANDGRGFRKAAIEKNVAFSTGN